MAKNDIGGVWRTVGGRRIFIKDGQDLASAMKESGKFKSNKKKSEYEKSEMHKKLEKDMGEELVEHTNDQGQKWYSSKSIDDEEKAFRDKYETKRLEQTQKEAQAKYEHAQDKYEHHKFDDNESESKQASRKAYEDAKDRLVKAQREEGEALAKESSKEFAKTYMQDQFKAFDKGNISGADLEKAKRDSGLSKKEIEDARNYVNNRAPESYPRQTENKTGKTTSQAVPKTSEKAKEFWDTYKMNDAEYESFAKQVVSENSKGYPYNKISLWPNKEGKYNPETDKWEFKGMKGISNGQQSTKIEVDRDGNLYEDKKLVYDNTFKTMSGKYDYKIAPSDNAKVSTTRPKQNQSTNESNVRKLFDKDKEYKFNNNVKNETEWKEKNKAILEKGYKEETGTEPYKNGKAKTSFEDYQTWRYGKEADKENKTGKTTSQAVPTKSILNTMVEKNADIAEKIIEDDEWNDIKVTRYGNGNSIIQNERTGKNIKITPSDTKESLNKKIEDSYKESKNSNDWVRNAFNDYKKEHPNTKMTLEQFKKSKK